MESQHFGPDPMSTTTTEHANGAFQSASDLITRQLQLETITSFSLKTFLSQIFSKHDDSEVELLFTVGTTTTTPQLNSNMGLLPSPWLFFRTLIASLVVYIIFLTAWNEFANINVIPGLIIIGSFAVPFAMVVLFFEINTPKNVSIIKIIQLLILGGSLSILLSLLLFDITPALGVFGASAAGFVEETGKLITVVLALNIIMKRERYPYLLNALLFGATVGAGFAAFESAGYALRIGLQDTQAMLENITLRGAMAPFGHIVWTSIATASYWRARRSTSDFLSAVTSRSFLTLFAAPVGLHFVWNMPFQGAFLIKFWILGFIAWVIVVSLIQTGLKEITTVAGPSNEHMTTS